MNPLLDQKIQIENRGATKTANGEDTYIWASFYIAWAERVYKGGGEGFDKDQEVSTGKNVFRVRYKSGVNTTMRVNDGSLYYDILNVEVEGRNHFSVLHCQIKDNV